MLIESKPGGVVVDLQTSYDPTVAQRDMTSDSSPPARLSGLEAAFQVEKNFKFFFHIVMFSWFVYLGLKYNNIPICVGERCFPTSQTLLVQLPEL